MSHLEGVSSLGKLQRELLHISPLYPKVCVYIHTGIVVYQHQWKPFRDPYNKDYKCLAGGVNVWVPLFRELPWGICALNPKRKALNPKPLTPEP